jgi:hypothetical protein
MSPAPWFSSYECCQVAQQAFVNLVLSVRRGSAAFLFVGLHWLPTGADEVIDRDGNWERLPGLGVLFPPLRDRTSSYSLPQVNSGLTRCLGP